MSESIQDRVLRVIATTRRLPVETVRPDSTFEELGIDSLDRINILFELETEFEIEISDEHAAKVTSLQQMIDGITMLVEAKEKGIEPVWPESLAASPAGQAEAALKETEETPGESTED
ncbi:MAG TPA: phosphopantetheine-binding protein [Granulicella sp.]